MRSSIPYQSKKKDSYSNTQPLKPVTSAEKLFVPSIVGEVLATPGEPLNYTERAYFEARFGHNFSKVRVHTGDKAANSAQAIGARAYTSGRNIVFGNGTYEPHSQPGRSLLAHELTHVIQQQDKLPSGPLKLGAKEDSNERFAEKASSQIGQHAYAAPAVESGNNGMGAQNNTVQRSLLGGILGGIGGALSGAFLGGMVGGPIGAIVGGIAGLVTGAIIGDEATTKSRPLTSTEIEYAKDVYKDSIDYSKITISRDSMLAAGAPRTIGNTINLKSDWGHFNKDTLELTPAGLEVLIHEMGHVWQYQNGGLAYIPDSLWAQLKAKLRGESRNAAYNWKAAHMGKVSWEDWNPEQQASAIEDYNKLLRKSKDGSATVEEIAELATLTKYMENVWQKKGAPTYDAPAAEGKAF